MLPGRHAFADAITMLRYAMSDTLLMLMLMPCRQRFATLRYADASAA